jgi:putative transposase
VERLQAFRYEAVPTGDQRRNMSRFAGCKRVVYNKGLELQSANYAAGNKYIRYELLASNLGLWRRETPWLGEAPYHTLQQGLKDLDKAFRSFFARRAAYPVRKKKGRNDSFRFPDPKQIRLDQANDRIFLPKLGWLRYRNSREVVGKVKNVTVTANNGKWYFSIQTAREVEQVIAHGDAVGIDVGVVRMATLSDGAVVPPLNIFKRYMPALRKAQRAMSRKKKFSNNWKKAKRKVQRIHVCIANARRDYLHKTTTAISKNHALAVVEDLEVSNMSRSSSGTADQPGSNVRQKAGLNRSILDQGWGEFRRQLEYKMSWAGGQLVAVPAMNTSRTCPQCGHVSKDNRRSQANFACVECGFSENADLVAAINILGLGLKVLEGQDTAEASAGCASTARIACEVNCGVSGQQQEPTERAA